MKIVSFFCVFVCRTQNAVALYQTVLRFAPNDGGHA